MGWNELERTIRQVTCIATGFAYNMGIHGISYGSVETRNPMSFNFIGFRFLLLVILALQPHTTKSLGLLLLTVELVVQVPIC